MSPVYQQIVITVAVLAAVRVLTVLAVVLAQTIHEHLHADDPPPIADAIGFRMEQQDPDADATETPDESRRENPRGAS